ncbi:interleukin-17 receptor A [Salarias fasciatus]|uniref:interleukin-17 receptor A n=1 Tax=Salarias fasciatus TaxID=181472 RepID=UPI0011766D0F|nr:interleukin-17 receptor A-like [Salarias fasciatus]
MICVYVACVCLAAGFTLSSSLRMEERDVDCSRPGLDHCTIERCSRTDADRDRAPTGPEWPPECPRIGLDKHGLVPVMNVTWMIKADMSISTLRGSQINVVEDRTNQSVCVQFSFSTNHTLSPDCNRWTFSLDDVVVEPGHKYTLTVFNLPEPRIGHYRISRNIAIPGCDDARIQKAQICLENGSLWEPNMSVTVLTDKEPKKLSVIVGFETAKHSERYQVAIQSEDFLHSRDIFKENRTSLNVTFDLDLWQLSQCEMFIAIKPFFLRCKNNCWGPKTPVDYCLYLRPRTAIVKTAVVLIFTGCCLAYLLWRTCHTKDPLTLSSPAIKEQPAVIQIQERRRVLIIYSCDHPLYKHIVLKLCAFLAAKCGTEVILDRLDSARLGVLGSIQWLECHREQIERSSDKILILCSPGVQAKWRAMCGDKPVFLREDVLSPVGDMLTPSLSLMVPHFIQCPTFQKYIVAYFDDVCSEEDVPSPFKIAVRYKLMKQFEEVFFRILDAEKHEPGRVKQIEGVSEDRYTESPSGRALQKAIEAFQTYQLEHPRWFEDELVEGLDGDVEETSPAACNHSITVTDQTTCCVQSSVPVTRSVKSQ